MKAHKGALIGLEQASFRIKPNLSQPEFLDPRFDDLIKNLLRIITYIRATHHELKYQN